MECDKLHLSWHTQHGGSDLLVCRLPQPLCCFLCIFFSLLWVLPSFLSPILTRWRRGSARPGESLHLMVGWSETVPPTRGGCVARRRPVCFLHRNSKFYIVSQQPWKKTWMSQENFFVFVLALACLVPRTLPTEFKSFLLPAVKAAVLLNVSGHLQWSYKPLGSQTHWSGAWC